MIRRTARWIARHPIWVLVGVALVTAFFGAFAPRIEFLTDMEKMLPKGNPVIARFEETKEIFGSQSVVMVAMAAPEGESIFQLSSLKKLYALTSELEALEEEGLAEDVISAANMDVVRGTATALVVGPILPHPPETEEDARAFWERTLAERQVKGNFVLEDGSAALIMVKVAPEAEDDREKIDRLMREINAVLERYRGPEEFYVAGDAPVMYYMNLYMQRDLRTLFPIVVLVVVGVLLLSFRSFRGVILPLSVVLVAVIWTVGLMALCGVKFTMVSIFLPILLVAVGSAYGIHVVNDYFERARGGGDKRLLVAGVVEEMANPVFAAALTTAAGFLTLLSAFLPPIRHFGLFSAAGVLFAFVLSLTLIPAVLALLPLPRGRGRWAVRFPRLGERLSGIGRRGALAILLIVALAFGGFLSLTPRLRVESNMTRYFRPDSPVIKGSDFVDERFGGSVQLSIVVDTGKRDGIKDPKVLSFMDALQQHLKENRLVGSVSSIVDLIKETNYTLHGDDDAYYTIPPTKRAVAQVLLMYELGGGEVLKSMATRTFSKAQITAMARSTSTSTMEKLLADIEGFIAAHAPAGVRVYTTGGMPVYIEISHQLIRSQLVSIFTSFAAVGFIVAVLMGSLVAGLLSLVPLVVSVVGNFGTMVLAGANLDMATVMIASIVVGIGVDYAVHVITRYRRERSRGRAHAEALGVTYGTAGRAVVYNALTLALGFSVLLLSSFGAMATLGWLVALTMITSGLGALLVIPAILELTQPRFVTGYVRLRWIRGWPRVVWEAADPEDKNERRSG